MTSEHQYPADLRDTDVVSVVVTGPHRVRVTHRDGTSATYIFRPGDFGTSDYAALDRPEVFATAQVVEPGTLGWLLPGGAIYDVAPDGLWAHARGWCPDGSHDLAAEVEDARIELSAPTMRELHPTMRQLLDAGWVLQELVKPVLEGVPGAMVRATFTRGEVSGNEKRIQVTAWTAECRNTEIT